MKKFWFFVLILLFSLAACATQPSATAIVTTTAPTATSVPPTTVPTPVSPFNYDPSVPFDTKIISRTEQGGATVTELSYATHDPSFAMNMGGRTLATLVSPTGSGPFAGILSLYSLGEDINDKNEYLSEAITLAQHGAISLLPQVYFISSAEATGSQSDRPMIIGQVIELRRAIDFLLAQPGIDPRRLGLVGHGESATFGGVLAGMDKRAGNYVLIGGFPDFADVIWGNCCIDSPTISVDTIQPFIKDIDATNFVPNAAPASLFFQYGKKNTGNLTESLANQYYAAASQPKKIEWYDDQNSLNTDPPVQERQAWLIDQLKLAP